MQPTGSELRSTDSVEAIKEANLQNGGRLGLQNLLRFHPNGQVLASLTPLANPGLSYTDCPAQLAHTYAWFYKMLQWNLQWICPSQQSRDFGASKF